MIAGTTILISLSKDLDHRDRDTFLEATSESAHLTSDSGPHFAMGWEVFVAVAKDLGAAAGAASAVIKLGTVILAWFNGVRKEKRSTQVELRVPGLPTLRLDEVSEAEIRAWFKRLAEGNSAAE